MRRPFRCRRTSSPSTRMHPHRIDTKKDPGKWQKVQNNLEALKTFTPNPAHPTAPQARIDGTVSERRTAVGILLRK